MSTLVPTDTTAYSPELAREEFLDYQNRDKLRRCGLEYERLFLRAAGGPVPYEGEEGIRSLFGCFEKRGWEPILDEGFVVALSREGHLLALEPGGQFEFSARARASLLEIKSDFCGFLSDLQSILEEQRPGTWKPHQRATTETALEDCPFMPKRRYPILRERLKTAGSRGLRMMQQTVGIQLNVDYNGPEELDEMWSLALRLSPLFNALSANSPNLDGTPGDWASHRQWIWLDTDASRCLAPPVFFERPFTQEKYLQWAASVPMLFRLREEQWQAMPATGFTEYAAGGEATLGDWQLHLTGLFTELRLKPHLEIRGMDTVPPPLALALTALWMGVLYQDDVRREIDRLLPHWTRDQWLALYEEVARHGTRGQSPDGLSVQEHLTRLQPVLLEALDTLPGAECCRPLAEAYLDAGSPSHWALQNGEFLEGTPEVLQEAFTNPYCLDPETRLCSD